MEFASGIPEFCAARIVASQCRQRKLPNFRRNHEKPDLDEVPDRVFRLAFALPYESFAAKGVFGSTLAPGLIVGTSGLGRNVLKCRRFLKRTTYWDGFGLNLHQVQQSLDFFVLDLNSPLALASPLVIIDRHWLSPNHECARIRLGQPVIQRRRTDSQSAGGVL